MLAVVLLMALIAQLNPSRNASANINAYPLQPSINARADAIALYKQKTELTTLCDVAGGLRAIAMLGTDKITLYQEAKKEDSNCLGISTKLHDIQIPQSLGRPVAAAFAQAMDHCQSAYLSQWSAAHSLESALDDGKAGDMAAFRDRQANMLSENAVCSRGLISAADLLGVTRAELESGLLNGAREGQLQTQPTGAIGNSSDQSGSTDSYHSATTTNLTDYNFEDYPSERFMGPNVNPDFSGKQRPFRQYRTAIRDSVKQGPVFAGSVAVAEVGCGTDCGMGFAIDLTNGNVFDLPVGGEATLDMTTEYHAGSRLLKAAWTGQSTNPACSGFGYFEWTAEGFKTLKRSEPSPHQCQ